MRKWVIPWGFFAIFWNPSIQTPEKFFQTYNDIFLTRLLLKYVNSTYPLFMVVFVGYIYIPNVTCWIMVMSCLCKNKETSTCKSTLKCLWYGGHTFTFRLRFRRILLVPELFQWNIIDCVSSFCYTHSQSRALLEEPPIMQPLKNFPSFYGTRRFNTVFTRAFHWSLTWAISIESTPSHPISLECF
jgi:hypothetical protein